ncbi:MAG: hypothetical protein E5W87_22835 [Mesorhizobium sp.]|nr:MAG: hypothetical protein E5W87_22835 [Mesorhizobium sp.]
MNQGFLIDRERLPPEFPTHLHSAAFWETLGRAIATYGFLEETLGKAIFAFTGTRETADDAIEAEFGKWLVTLRRALIDPLGGLIDAYDRAVQNHPGATISNLPDLIHDLRAAATLRNVLCHGSWRAPDEDGRAVPLFVDRKDRIFETPIDVAYLEQTQRHVVELICAVVNSVTHMGWQFPGSKGPGLEVLKSRSNTP